jgi:hypothetical protein
VTCHLGTVSDLGQLFYLLPAQVEPKGNLDFLDDGLHCQPFPLFLVSEPGIRIPFPLGRETSGPDKTKPCLHGKFYQLRPEHLFSAPDPFEEPEADIVIAAEGILDDPYAVKLSENPLGNF